MADKLTSLTDDEILTSDARAEVADPDGDDTDTTDADDVDGDDTDSTDSDADGDDAS